MGYSATIRNELPSHKKIWMNLKYILLNKRSQFEKAKKRSGEVFFLKDNIQRYRKSGCITGIRLTSLGLRFLINNISRLTANCQGPLYC